jgi:UDP-2,4-diacetamido-2,4,6-trideoxy-beta-L-altropyranose hydrolase
MGSAEKPLLIRADANARMGTGHLMRCLALAQAWQAQGGEAVFITACSNDGLRQRLFDEGFQVIAVGGLHPNPADWASTSKPLVAHPGAWVVLDGYHFDPSYQLRIKEAGHPLLVIDDMAHLDHYYADVVLNQNIHAGQLDYAREPYTRLLLGTRYVLLRREFWPWRQWQREVSEVARRVLVTLGGADPDNQTRKVIRALQQIDVDGLEAVVVVGASNPHYQELEFAIRNSQFTVRLARNVYNMPELMAWADVAVSAGGSTCWEIAFMGLPNVVLMLAENQREVAEGLDRYGVALNLGWYTGISESSLARVLNDIISDPTRRKATSEKGKQLVDGTGVERVAATLDPSDAEDSLQVRPARWEDVELLWRWANDPTVRANSFHPDLIPLDDHMEWYKDKLASSDTHFWIIEHDQVPVAQIRYDRVHRTEAKISFSVARDHRGRGIGTKTVTLTFEMACKELGAKHIKGIVFSSNKASQRAFIKAGFRNVGQERVSGKPCHVFVRECPETTGETL